MLVMVAPKGNLLAYATEYLLAKHRLLDVGHTDVGFYCAHATANVNAYGIRDHHTFCRQHSANGHTFAAMSIWHQRKMMVDERQLAEVAHFLLTMLVEVVDPAFHDDVVDDFYFHNCLFL